MTPEKPTPPKIEDPFVLACLDANQSAYHQTVARAQKAAYDSYYVLFRKEVAIIRASSGCDKEDAEAMAADTLEETWLSIKANLQELKDHYALVLAKADAEVLQQWSGGR